MSSARSRLHAALLASLLVAASPDVLALDPRKAITQYVQDVWQMEQGLPQNSVAVILQTRDGYLWLGLRSAVVPAVSIGSRVLPFLMLITIFSMGGGSPGIIAYVMVAALAAIALFTLITLPVEFDASARALKTIDGAGILVGDELDGAKQVLDAAALTYVAAAVHAVFELLKWAAILFGGRRSND